MNLKPMAVATAMLLGAGGAMAAKASSETARTELVKSFQDKNTKVFSIFVKGFC